MSDLINVGCGGAQGPLLRLGYYMPLLHGPLLHGPLLRLGCYMPLLKRPLLRPGCYMPLLQYSTWASAQATLLHAAARATDRLEHGVRHAHLVRVRARVGAMVRARVRARVKARVRDGVIG